MSNVICHICQINLALKQYDGVLLDEDGNKPCLECVIEDAESNEEEDEQ